MCMHGVNRGAHVRQSSSCGCKRGDGQRRSSLAISAFALARQGLRCAALIGIGASTTASINFDEQ